MGLEKRDSRTFASILGDSTIRVTTDESTEGAVSRKYKNKQGVELIKWELVYNSLSGIINGIKFEDGDWGVKLNITVDDVVLSMGLKTNYAEDLMKKLPAIDFNSEVKLIPFNFKGTNGKMQKGFSIKQNGEKIKSFFWDKENKKSINGVPSPEGDTTKFDKDDWINYYNIVRKFLQKYTEENVFPKLSGEATTVVPDADIKLDDTKATMEAINGGQSEAPAVVDVDPTPEVEVQNKGLENMFKD